MAKFLISSPSVEGCLEETQPEVAFLGRSNVGKSSLLGAMLEQPTLVRRSRTPGRTQLINYFEDNMNNWLVDLPGYGYADVPAKVQYEMQDMIKRYVLERGRLTAVVLLMDARREGPSDEDRAWFEFIQTSGRRVQVVMTKSDRIGKAQRKPAAHRLEEQLGLERGGVLICSATDGTGVSELQKRVTAWLS